MIKLSLGPIVRQHVIHTIIPTRQPIGIKEIFP